MDDQKNVLNEENPILHHSFTRRSLVKWSSVLAGAAVIGTSSGCAGFDSVQDRGSTAEASGKWIPANCWADCGSKGFNKVYVEGGKAVRMGTDTTIEDSPACPQMRSCARGRALRGMIFGADRIKYPMKRKHWEPGGGGDRTLRGKDEWERISWDDALDLISGEVERIVATYGNDAILIPGYVASLFGNWDIGRTLALYGGYLEHWGSCSSGAWGSLCYLYGLAEMFNDRMDLEESDLIILWGSNPAWSRAGRPTYNYSLMKEKGVKFISIDIFYNATAQALAEEWIPIRPSTDVALVAGLAYVMITEDDPQSNPLIDWDFLNSCSIGFDANHMPEGADPKDNYRDYILGTYDGVPKTPHWASEITGIPAAKIVELANLICKTEKVAICMAPSSSRTTNGTVLPQAMMTLGAMTGKMGKPGCMVGSDAGHSVLMEGAPLVRGGSILGEPSWTTANGREWIPNPIGGDSPHPVTGFPNGMYSPPKPPYKRVNINEIWTSILDGEYTTGYQKKEPCKVQMIWHTHENVINQAPGTMLAIEAHRKVETVIAQNIVMTTTCKYADIILPITSQWERYGDVVQGYRENMMWYSQVTEPLFEAQSDLWVAVELAKRIGVDPSLVEPYDLKQEVFNWAAGCEVVKEDGKTYEKLVSITEDDIKEFEVEGTTQEGRIPIMELKEKGIFQVPRTPDDNFRFICLEDFRNDPEANPLGTASGKLEIYCQAAVDQVKNCGWEEIPPIAKYYPSFETYEDTFSDWSTKTKGEFPLQLVSIHILRHSHSSFANVPSLREAFDHPLYMNPLDAQSRGLETGDTVLITSKWGKSLRPVLVTEIITPGVTALGQGAWAEIDEETGIDKAGCTNVLNGPNTVGCGHQAWNSCIVEVKAWEGEPLAPDCTWEPYVELKEV